MKEVWIVGRINKKDYLEGIFDSEEKAVNACRGKQHFVAPATLLGPILIVQRKKEEKIDRAGCDQPSQG